MKVLYCSLCGDIRAPEPTGREWVYCRCGQAAMRWENVHTGTAKVRARKQESVRVIGIHNEFLRFAFHEAPQILADGTIVTRHPSNDDWRKFHAEMTEEASGYLFHTSKRACGMVIIRVGQSNDVTMVDWEDPGDNIDE